MANVKNNQVNFLDANIYNVSDSCFSIEPLPIGIIFTEIGLPKKHRLLQNYPNPFNPSTTIEFTLPRPEYTTLKIYNILGAEVATLVSDKLQAGRHTYHFDGSKLASGVYYYQLMAGEFRDVRMMILLRKL